MRAELCDLLPGLFDSLHKMRVIWQIITENFTQGKQGGDALFTATARNKFANFIAKRIANINGISGIINMPLFIINELHLPEKLAGVMMGTAAGLEIPTMLIAGYFAKRLGKRFLMRVAAVGGVSFYAGMLMAHSPVILLGLQLLNAIFIGILGGIGMLYFQDLMPGQAGSATTLYTNTSRVGWIIAGSVAGIVAEIWNYHAVFWFAMVMIIATLFCLLRIKDV